jgi:peptidoglycan/xylan/chitin deacetylase (PgdA/CDA1 family)
MSVITSTISTLARALPATRANRLLILIYHRVHPRPDPMFPGEVDAERFDWQMALLRRYCNPMSLAEAVEGLTRGQLPPRAVAITFDDGYADNVSVALPILEKHGLTSTFFIATGFLDGGRMWNDSIIESVRAADGDMLDATEIGLGEWNILTPAARGVATEGIIKAVKHLPPQARQDTVSRLCELVDKPLPANLMMSSAQVGQLAEAGMEVGAHTVTHPILKNLTDQQAKDEIAGSRHRLETIVGAPVQAFAYPNGRPGEDYTERDRAIVESMGFAYAPSTRQGAASNQSDRYQLPRFTPWDRLPERWLGRLLERYRSAA